jgi:K+-transporting ATPase A subunit
MKVIARFYNDLPDFSRWLVFVLLFLACLLALQFVFVGYVDVLNHFIIWSSCGWIA